jgi:sugar phosphate isomerase/epimerase
MKRTSLLLLFFTYSFISFSQAKMKPQDTEDWSRKPEMVESAKGKKAPTDAIILYSGKQDASNWQHLSGEPIKWKATNALTAQKGAGNIETKQSFGDVQLHIEWRTPHKIEGEGQGRGNSGVFLMGLYEVQILDSYQNETYYNGQAGSIYKQHIPLVNASKGPGKWQSYDIFFKAPRFHEDQSLKSPAYITVVHNGILIQNNVELYGPTEYIGLPKYKYHPEKLPLQLQDHSNPTSFRNIWVRELTHLNAQPSAFLDTSCPLEDNGWKLAVQAWSFNRFTFVETLKHCSQMGIKYIEAYPGQEIGGGIEGSTHFSMNQSTQEEIKKLLKHFDIQLVNYGVATCKTEEEWTQLFQFAKDMGIETINSEPAFSDMDLVEKLAREYQIQVGIHNHATPTRYWEPATVLKVIDGRSNLLGASCDNGHWMRSGIQPVDGYQQLEGHIVSLHFKDMNQFDNIKAHTVPFGTGEHDIPATLKELKRQGFKGVMTIEYEHNWKNPVPDIRQSIAYLKEIAKTI